MELNQNNILIVTGEPRSGTSLMMQILEAMEYPIEGEKFPMEDRLEKMQDRDDIPPERLQTIQNRVDHAKQMNPEGFYETRFVSRGIHRANKENLQGKAIKVITSAAFPLPNNNGTHPNEYSKAILCLRHPDDIAKSQVDLITSSIEVAGESDDWQLGRFAASYERYIMGTGSFLCWLAEQDQSVLDKYERVDFDDMISNPQNQINKVAAHIGVKDNTKIDSAIGVVKQDLSRSSRKEIELANNQIQDLAHSIYESLSNFDQNEMLIVKNEIEEYQENKRLERVRWVDNEFGTYRLINPSLYRSLSANNNNVRDNLLKRASRFDITKHKDFQESRESYTIKRPSDIGDLDRPLLNYNGELITWEEFRIRIKEAE